MKKQLQLLCIMALVAVMGLSSCSKALETRVVGQWEIIELMVDNESDPEAIGETWTFKDDGSYIGWRHLKKVESQDQIDFYVTANYMVEDEELTINFAELRDAYAFDIVEITGKDLSMSGKIKWKEWYNGDFVECSCPISVKLRRK